MVRNPLRGSIRDSESTKDMAPKRLFLVRHGIAVEPTDWDQNDDDRPLTPEGEKKTAQIARGFRKLDERVDLILTSPLPRALQTAHIFAEALSLQDELNIADWLHPENSAETIAEKLTHQSSSRIMIVGHNMNLSMLVGELLGQSSTLLTELRKGGIAALDKPLHSSNYQLDWLATPKLLRKISKAEL